MPGGRDHSGAARPRRILEDFHAHMVVVLAPRAIVVPTHVEGRCVHPEGPSAERRSRDGHTDHDRIHHTRARFACVEALLMQRKVRVRRIADLVQGLGFRV